MANAPDMAATLAEAADFYYTANALYEDDDLDADDHLAVVLRNFTSSDCDAFADVVAEMTGWTTVRATWTVREDFGHHTLVRAPDGRLFDAAGFTDEAGLRKRYRARNLRLADAPPLSVSHLDDPEDLRRIADVVRILPHAPFDGPGFRAVSLPPLKGEAPREWEREVAVPSGP